VQRLLSTYPFVSRKLTREVLGQIANAGFTGIEIFCSRAHFDYTSRNDAREMAGTLADLRLTLISMHAPTSRDMSAMRESGQPLSICEVERVRRIEAMDELKRAIDVAEDLPFPRMIFHMGGTRESADLRKRDAAFSSLEHLILHARHVGVTVCLENTTSEMGDPAYLRAFYDETRLGGLRFNFDIGHANLADGPPQERIEKSFAPLRDLVTSAHIHDNHGDKDEHLLPYEGSIDWGSAVKTLRTAPDNFPLVLELKEKTAADAPGPLEQLKAAHQAWSRLEEQWDQS
jgi:sugar phosphate isomerase/epimerase